MIWMLWVVGTAVKSRISEQLGAREETGKQGNRGTTDKGEFKLVG